MGAMDEDRFLRIAMFWQWMLFICVQNLEFNNIHPLVVTIEVPFNILDN